MLLTRQILPRSQSMPPHAGAALTFCLGQVWMTLNIASAIFSTHPEVRRAAENPRLSSRALPDRADVRHGRGQGLTGVCSMHCDAQEGSM